ncbi:MAG: response regulator [Candidatus Daviesbacteria bacterium]|nr:response regulator [Candidatus Daviesbacteria bacterium]
MTEQEVRRVAVVDDAKELCKIIRFMLSEEPQNLTYEVITYQSVKEIKSLIEGDPEQIPVADLWFIDLGLGPYDGRQVIRKVRAASPSSTTIIAFTASSKAVELCQGTGADAYLGKPVEIEQVLDLVSSPREVILSGALDCVRLLPVISA